MDIILIKFNFVKYIVWVLEDLFLVFLFKFDLVFLINLFLFFLIVD